MRAFLVAIVCIMAFTAYAFADTIDIKPAFIQQMDYKVSQLMPCNWDPASTMVHGYYGEMPELPESESQLDRMEAWKNAKSQLTKVDLGLATQDQFGLNLNLGFDPAMMALNGMPLQIVEIEYARLNKKCKSGFGSGIFTK